MSSSTELDDSLANIAHYSVVFFFTLSGFLIFYLFFRSVGDGEVINKKTFYLRRALRIWPPYYLVLVIGIWILPVIVGYPVFQYDTYVGLREAFFFLMLPNIGIYISGTVQYVGHLWSIGVEEQMYLIAPWVARRFFRSPAIILALMAASVGIRVAFWSWFDEETTYWKYKLLMYFFDWWEVEAFLAGAFAAWLFHQKRWKQIREHTAVLGLTFLTLGYLVWCQPFWNGIEKLLLAVTFGLVLLQASGNTILSRFLEWKLLRYWGERSYGIYIYHYPILMVAAYLLFRLPASPENPVVFYVIGISASLITAWLSYKYLEKPLLGLRKKLH